MNERKKREERFVEGGWYDADEMPAVTGAMALPIGSRPRDGRRILVFDKSWRIVGSAESLWLDDCTEITAATHWMPLPDDPTNTA